MHERVNDANNKIISREVLLEIFETMHRELTKWQQLADEEKAKNEPLQEQYQQWTLRYFSGDLSFQVYFRDNHDVSYHDYDKFLAVFKSQAGSIRHLYAHFTMSYNKPGENNEHGEHMYNSIEVSATEDRFSVGSNIASGDTYMNDVYNLILQKVAEAPPKYDHIIKAKELINLKIGFAMGLIPATAIMIASLFIPQLHEFYKNYFFLFPALILLLAISFGFFLGSAKTGSGYAKLIPQKYAGYDSNRGGSYYNDDIKTLTETSEVLIGSKSDNMVVRRQIAEYEKRYSKLILPFLGVAAIASIVAFFLTR